jgi:short-subunit dehydrogenase
VSVLILGCTSPIAQSVAAEFARRKINIHFAARRLDAAKKLCNDFSVRYSVSAKAWEFDARNYKTHKKFIEDVFSDDDIECILIAFGYLGEQEKSERDISEAQKVIETNYTGAVSVCELAAERFLEKGRGTIAAISSVAGDRGRKSNYIYGSAKSALSTYLSGLRNRLYQNNIHVLTIKPGFVDTPMTFGMKIPRIILALPERVGRDIYKAIVKRKNILYTPFYWRWIMLIIKLIPEFVFKKLSL